MEKLEKLISMASGLEHDAQYVVPELRRFDLAALPTWSVERATDFISTVVANPASADLESCLECGAGFVFYSRHSPNPLTNLWAEGGTSIVECRNGHCSAYLPSVAGEFGIAAREARGDRVILPVPMVLVDWVPRMFQSTTWYGYPPLLPYFIEYHANADSIKRAAQNAHKEMDWIKITKAGGYQCANRGITMTPGGTVGWSPIVLGAMSCDEGWLKKVPPGGSRIFLGGKCLTTDFAHTYPTICKMFENVNDVNGLVSMLANITTTGSFIIPLATGALGRYPSEQESEILLDLYNSRRNKEPLYRARLDGGVALESIPF